VVNKATEPAPQPESAMLSGVKLAISRLHFNGLTGFIKIENYGLKIKPEKFLVKFSAPFALVFRIG
jgi:hypothetical protein